MLEIGAAVGNNKVLTLVGIAGPLEVMPEVSSQLVKKVSPNVLLEVSEDVS